MQRESYAWSAPRREQRVVRRARVGVVDLHPLVAVPCVSVLGYLVLILLFSL